MNKDAHRPLIEHAILVSPMEKSAKDLFKQKFDICHVKFFKISHEHSLDLFMRSTRVDCHMNRNHHIIYIFLLLEFV